MFLNFINVRPSDDFSASPISKSFIVNESDVRAIVPLQGGGGFLVLFSPKLTGVESESKGYPQWNSCDSIEPWTATFPATTVGALESVTAIAPTIAGGSGHSNFPAVPRPPLQALREIKEERRKGRLNRRGRFPRVHFRWTKEEDSILKRALPDRLAEAWQNDLSGRSWQAISRRVSIQFGSRAAPAISKAEQQLRDAGIEFRE